MARVTYTVLFLCVHCGFAGLQGAVAEESHTTSVASPPQKDSSPIVNAVSSDGTTQRTGHSTAARMPTQSTLWTKGALLPNSTSLVLNITNNYSFTARPDLTASFTALATVSLSNTTSGNVTVDDGSIDVVAANPGLVAVLCIFFITLTLVVAIGIAHAVNSRKPKFETLEDFPMDKMNENSPFAQYPPK